MTHRIIVLFLCFYAGIMLATKSDGLSPRLLKKADSDPVPLIENATPISDNNNTPPRSPKDLEKDAPENPTLANITLDTVPTKEEKQEEKEEESIEPTQSISVINFAVQEVPEETESTEEIKIASIKRIHPHDTKLFKQLFAKKIGQYNKASASVLHFALNKNQECLTITTQNNIYIYSAITGKQKSIITFKRALPIVRTKFVTNDVLMLLTTGPTRRNETNQPIREKIRSYININPQKDIKSLSETEIDENQLWASVSLHSITTQYYNANDLDIITSQELKNCNLDYQEPTYSLIGDTKIIKGAQRCITITQDPSFDVLVYDLEKFYASQYVISDESDLSEPPTYQEVKDSM